MKTLKIANGEIRLGYELRDLDRDVENEVIVRYRGVFNNFGGNDYDNDMRVLELIEINGYLFDENGNDLDINCHMAGDKLIKMTFGKKDYLVEFI